MQDYTEKQPTYASLKWFNFFIYGTIVIFTSFFQLYLQDVGMNKLEIGTLMSIGPFVSLFANPFWGIWADRSQNIRKVMLFMLIGTLIFSQLVFRAGSFEMIYITMLLFFFFQTPLFAQSNTMILGYIDGTAHRFGSFRLWGSLGWAFTAIAAGPLIGRLGIPALPYLFTVLLAFTISALLLLPKPEHGVGTAPAPFKGLGSIIMNPLFLCFIFFGILVAVPNAMNSTFMTLYISDMGGSKEMIGLAVFLSSILEAAVFLLCDRLLRRKISVMVGWLGLVSLLFALRWWLMSEATSPLQVALIQVLHSLTFGGYFYVGTQLTMLFVPRQYRSSGQALYTLTWSGIAGIVGGLLGGWLFQNLGAQSMYKFGVFLSIIGSLGFGFMWLFVVRGGYRPSSEPNEHDEMEP